MSSRLSYGPGSSYDSPGVGAVLTYAVASRHWPQGHYLSNALRAHILERTSFPYR